MSANDTLRHVHSGPTLGFLGTTSTLMIGTRKLVKYVTLDLNNFYSSFPPSKSVTISDTFL